MHARTIFVWGCALGGTGVLLGALGTHALRPFLEERGFREAWEVGVRYQLVHALALMALSAWMQHGVPAAARRAGCAAVCWIAGSILFSGSLYGLAAGGPRWLGPVTPAGGLLLLGGWALALAAGLARPKDGS